MPRPPSLGRVRGRDQPLSQLLAEPRRVARLQANTALFRAPAAESGIDTGNGTAAAVPVMTGSSTRALLLADHMRRHGVDVQPIIAPAVDDNAARLRFFIKATHTAEQIRTAVEHVATMGASANRGP